MKPGAPAGKPAEQQASAKGNLEIKNLLQWFSKFKAKQMIVYF